jgi:hypothetical protein
MNEPSVTVEELVERVEQLENALDSMVAALKADLASLRQDLARLPRGSTTTPPRRPEPISQRPGARTAPRRTISEEIALNARRDPRSD